MACWDISWNVHLSGYLYMQQISSASLKRPSHWKLNYPTSHMHLSCTFGFQKSDYVRKYKALIHYITDGFSAPDSRYDLALSEPMIIESYRWWRWDYTRPSASWNSMIVPLDVILLTGLYDNRILLENMPYLQAGIYSPTTWTLRQWTTVTASQLPDQGWFFSFDERQEDPNWVQQQNYNHGVCLFVELDTTLSNIIEDSLQHAEVGVMMIAWQTYNIIFSMWMYSDAP